MEGTTDHGEVLTRFEEVFGTLVEHEVIKMVLQGCEWETRKASETLMTMIDENDLPPHILAAVLADNVVRRTSEPKEPAPQDEVRAEEVPEDKGEVNTSVSQEQEVEPNLLRSNSLNGLMGNKSVLTPLAWAHGTIIGESSERNREKQESGSPSVRPKIRREKEIESDVSSPSNSPLKINAAESNESSCIKDTSQWVLAPEFVPNAFTQTAYSGIWPLKVPVNQSMTPPAQPWTNVKEQSPVRAKISKREEVVNKIVSGVKIMVLMRGLPGSGKTTLAKIIKGRSGVILSTDDFFCNEEGVYRYDPHRLPEAHGWNKHRALVKVQEGRTPVIIDNTNVQAWEMKPYIIMALHHGYEVDILEPETGWKFSPKELAKRNIHGVPKYKISEMKEHYDSNSRILNVISNLKSAQSSSTIKNENCDNTLEKKNVDPNLPLKEGEIVVHKQVDLHLSPSQKIQNVVEGCEDEDADVIVEGYEDEEEIGTVQNQQNSQIVEDCQVRNKGGRENVDVSGPEVTVKTTGEENTDIENDMNFDENGLVDMTDEDRIKFLIEEANNDVDNIETDWDDLALQASCEEEVDDTKFNDLVTSFGSAVKQQLERGSQVNGTETPIIHNLDEEDSAMYEFCSNVEERLGKPLSTLVRPGNAEDYSALLSVGSDQISENRTSDSQDLSLFSLISMSEAVVSSTGATENVQFEKREVDTKNKSVLSSIDKTGLEESGGVTGLTYQQDKIKTAGHNESKQYVDLNIPLENGTENQYQDLLDSDRNELSELENRVENSEQEKSLSNTLSSESTQTLQTPGSDTTTVGESFTSWECVDPDAGVSSVSWESQKGKSSDSDEQCSKPGRSRRKRAAGDPLKWLREEGSSNSNGEPSDVSWEPVQGGVTSWDNQEKDSRENKLSNRKAKTVHDNSGPQAHTGAVPKLRRHQKHTRTPSMTSNSSSQSDDQIGRERESPVSDSQSLPQNVTYAESETQTLSIDFEALQLDNNLYELKVLYGQPNYKPKSSRDMLLTGTGPLTKGRLRLDKGTMTEEVADIVVVKPLQNLSAFFPNIPEEDLRDVLQKCKYDLDWAMNVLLDSGYEMSAAAEIDTSQEEPLEADVDTESVVETTSTGDGKDDRSSFADWSDTSDMLVEDRSRKMKQSQDPIALTSKKEIEASFALSESVDDRVKRLTGKEYNELNTSKVKQAKSKKKHGNKKDKSAKTETLNEGNKGDNTGAQYITLVMDPLFASQLTSMFGSVGSCIMNGDLSPEDRSVILPLELCHQIHKYWADTLEGKFSHEAEVLDSLIREDENLARRLQDEEDAGTSSNHEDNNSTCAFKLDPPTSLREIMDLEQAIQESQDGEANIGDPSLSSRLNLQRLYAEYPHVDPEALKEEFTRSGYNYRDTVERLCNRYGAEQGAPKTVIAPEAMYRYEQQMILQAQKESLDLEEKARREREQEEEIQPDDPQVYRDEAQMHYQQRQEAFRKAQEASRQGMKAVAAYYARIGNLHTTKLIEANNRASKKILEAVNAKKKDANTLDLHLLHVNEALGATQAFLKERERVLTTMRGVNQMQVFLITGRGNHSIGGQARLKPAIKDFLRGNGYLFHEANSGMFVVTLRA